MTVGEMGIAETGEADFRQESMWSKSPRPQDAHTYSQWVLGSFFMSLLIHHLISPQIFTRLLPAYRRLDRNKRMEWDSRVLSTLHAVCVCHFSLSCLLSDMKVWTNPVDHYVHEGFIALSIAAGYMLCDMISMPMYWGGKALITFLIHHATVLLAAYLIITYRAGAFFGVFRLLTELSTPALNMRWFLRTMGHKSNEKPVMVTTVAFVFAFFLCRYATIPIYWGVFLSWYGSGAHLEMIKRNPYITEMGIGVGILFDILNLVWGQAVATLGWRAFKVWRSGEAVDQMPNASASLGSTRKASIDSGSVSGLATSTNDSSLVDQNDKNK